MASWEDQLRQLLVGGPVDTAPQPWKPSALFTTGNITANGEPDAPAGGDYTYGPGTSAASLLGYKPVLDSNDDTAGRPAAAPQVGPIQDPTQGGRFIPLPGGGFYDSALGKEVGANLEKLLGGHTGGAGGGTGVTTAELLKNSTVVAQIKADSAERVAQIQANEKMDEATKKVELDKLDRQAQLDAANAKAAGDFHIAQLTNETQRAIAEGNWANAAALEAAKAKVAEETAALSAYTEVLKMASQERGQKAQAAASIFDSIAKMAPQENLRSAYYVLKGQAPPAPFTANMPAGLLAALGQNPDTVNAAALTMRGTPQMPPWIMSLMGNQQTASTPAPALPNAAPAGK